MATPVITVATIGDSITAGTPLWDPDPAVRAAKERVDERSQWQHWAALRDRRLRFANYGVNRQETREIAERLEAAAAGADVLVIQGGVNDLVHGRSVADAAAGITALAERAVALARNVLVAELIPNNNFAIGEGIRALNAHIRTTAAACSLTVLPFYATLESRVEPGRLASEWTDDGNHPSIAGHRRLGELAFRLPTGYGVG